MIFQRNRPAGCLSDFLLDHYLCDELDDGKQEHVRIHLESCSLCSARLEAIEAERQAFCAGAPPLEMKPARQEDRRGVLIWAPAVVLAALAVVTLVVWVSTSDEGAEGTRTKGRARLGFYINHGGQVREGRAGEIVHPGDSLLFTYSTSRPGYLAILSVDGTNRVSVYFPDGDRAAAIQPGEAIALDESAVLDDVLGTESFYGQFCSEPVRIDRLRAALDANPHEPKFPQACSVYSFSIEKRGRPR